MRSELFTRAFRILVTLAALGYVTWELVSRKDEFARLWSAGLTPGAWACLLVAIFLMPFNYLAEAQKWRVVVQPFYPHLRLGRAFSAVLAGMAAGIFTPNRVGEYAGRVLFLAEGSRVEAIVATFLDRICQLMVTILCGLLALGALLWRFGGDFLSQMLDEPIARTLFVVFALAMGAVTLIFLLAPARFARWIPNRWNSAVWIRKIRFALTRLAWRRVLQVLGLSLFRYLLFSTQYLLLMYAFGYAGDAPLGYALIAMTFLGKSILPVMGIFELGVRETVAVLVMGAFHQSAPMALTSTFGLYVINILLPTILGVIALQRIRSMQ